MNCDFSSNNNIWARFYEFLWWPYWIWLGYFYYDRLIGISRKSFLEAILNCVISDFRLQISVVPTELLQFQILLDIYLFVKCNRIQGAQYTYWFVSLLIWCYIIIRDASPTLKQHWFKRFVCEKNCNCYFNCSIWKVSTGPCQIHNIGSILGHRLRCWPGIETSDKCICIIKFRD